MKRAFTLIELLIVIIIIGILAIIAVPQYQKMVKRAKGAEALACFKLIQQAQEAYYLEHRKYQFIEPLPEPDSNWDNLGLENLNKKGNFVYDCKTGAAAAYFVRIIAYHLPDPGNRDYSTYDYDVRYYVRDDGQYKAGELYWDGL